MLQTFKQELTELRDTLLKIALTYQLNHDDGVQITAAPLWQLFHHKPWQKVLKESWASWKKATRTGHTLSCLTGQSECLKNAKLTSLSLSLMD
jgi:hypothetical protein